MPRRLGQHFLRNTRVLVEIAREVGALPGEPVIEIGGGHGELTGALRDRYPASPLFVLEKDPRLAAHLRARFSGSFTVIEADVRRSLGGVMAQACLGGASCVLAGNIPYYLTGHLLRMIGELEHVPRRTVLLVQREVAERVAAQPPRMNRLAAMVQFWAAATVGAKVPRADFSPPPAVDSALLVLERRERQPLVPRARYEELVKALFSQPRKTAANNLSAHGRKKSDISGLLARVGAREGGRPQDLSLGMILQLAESIS